MSECRAINVDRSVFQIQIQIQQKPNHFELTMFHFPQSAIKRKIL